MLRKLILIGLLGWPSLGFADAASSGKEYCERLLEEMKASTNPDPQSCIPTVGPPEPLEQCYEPFDYFGDRQASRVVLILDASGSMAGKISGRSKMSVAKEESSKFLRELARDLPVGLMVYGHKGTNQESGKLESCDGIEMLLPIAKSRRDIASKIAALNPTGWTPLAGALTVAEAEFGKFAPGEGDGDPVPVVYLVSDGEETCGGDPVAAARSLHESGVQATVHVIGFDVDENTRAQLEAISAAGGGKFFPAKDAASLRDHLNAARKAELSHRQFRSCIMRNERQEVDRFKRATNGMIACTRRETETKFGDVLLEQIDALDEDVRAACPKLRWDAKVAQSLMRKPLKKAYDDILSDRVDARDAARKYSIENALPSKQ